jgi:hypothetical protein
VGSKTFFRFSLALGILLGACGHTGKQHDLKLAAARVDDFIKLVMQENYRQAYDRCISAGIKYNPQYSYERITSDLREVRAQFGPMVQAHCTGYREVLGKYILHLYYDVEHVKVGKIVYHFVVEGYAKLGYSIFLIDIGNATADASRTDDLGPLLLLEPAPTVVPDMAPTGL